MTQATERIESAPQGEKSLADRIAERLGDAVIDRLDRNERRTWLGVWPSRIREATSILLKEFDGRLVTATGIDVRDGIEVQYHFSFDRDNLIVTLKVLAARPETELDSVGQDLAAANWIEREMYDLLGVKFRGHPDMRRLLLSDDWPEGVYPLRRDYQNENLKRRASGAMPEDKGHGPL